MANLTLQQLEDFLGNPIVILQLVHPQTHKVIELTLESLPPTAQAVVLQFINSHLP